MKKKAFLISLPLFLFSCGESNQPSKPTPTAKKVDVEKELCLRAKDFLPKGNHTIVYQKFKYGSCRIIAFYPPGETERLWYDLVIYRGTDGNIYAVYGIYVKKGGKLFVDKDELKAVKKFKMQKSEKNF